MNICIAGCPPGEQLFQFPNKGTDNERRIKWLKYFDMEDPKRIIYACERHFSNAQRCGSKLKLNGVPDIPLFRNIPGPFQRKVNSLSSNVIVVTPRDPEFVIYKNQTGIFSQDQFQNENYVKNTIQIPTLQPKHIIPTIKSISCSMSSQTNTRLCGSVQISEFLNEYRLNCFYCCDTFPIEQYLKFINHLKAKHFEEEEAFKIKKYPLGDHDYTTVRSKSPERINASPSQPRPKFIEAKDKPFNIGMAETLMKLLDETLLNPNFRNTEEDNILVIKNNSKLRATNVLQQIINKESNASPEAEKITLYNKESIPSITVNRNVKNDITLKSKTLPIKRNIEYISDTESEFETNTEFISSNTSPPQANIPECSISFISPKNIDSEKLFEPLIPLPPAKKILIKENDATVEKRVVQQTLKNINDFETVYKAVKKRPARVMSSGIFYKKDNKNNKLIEKQTSKKTPLNRCLKRANTETTESLPEATIILNPTELVFQFTPRDIILDLLDTIKDFPILWEFHKEPDNDDYAETISELCEKFNKNWSLNLSPLKMRRSINRIFTEYCYTLHYKKVVRFEEYFKKLAEFLPSSEDVIPRKRCQYCDICYAKESEMKRHLVEKHQYSNWQYSCNHCTERFMEIDEYELHKHLPHYLEIFKCQQCNKSFTTIYTLQRHKRNLHNPKVKVTTKPLQLYKCNMCDKEFKNCSELERHKTLHMEARFKCHLCPKAYNQKTTLTFHLKKHKHQLDFICEVCGKAFLKSSHLNTHLEKHTGEKITCNICHIKLRKCSLSRHLRLCHVACEGTIESTYRAQCYHYTKFLNKDYKDYRKTFRLKRPYNRTKEEGPRIYDCKKCNIPFDRLKFLKDHNNIVHSDVKVMPCKICKIEFRHTHNIKIHYRQKHNLSLFQVYKLHDQNMDLDTVLNLKTEDMPETVDPGKEPILKQDQSSLYCTNDEQDGYDGTNQNNCLQDEIMKAVENIDKQEIKVDNDQSMNKFFIDLLKQE